MAGDGLTDTLAQRLVLRRQLRSMLNNTPMKLQSYLYIIYSDDPDQNGWYVPDFGQLSDGEGSSGLATGWWNLEQVAWIMAGHKRINREARNIWMKDLRSGLNSRDLLRSVFSTDFAALPALQLTPLPHGATSIANAVNGQVPTLFPFLTGRDGGVVQVAVGLPDLACISYERLDSAWGTSDVIVYDRQGATDAPAAGPGPTWVEAYGPDFAWSWVSATPTGSDCPVLDNGLIRVRFDATNNDGFRVDVWNGSAYVEQGKMIVERQGLFPGPDNVWVSASLVEYTPDRAVIKVVLASTFDSFSREQVFITLQRGEMSATFEVYPSPNGDSTVADATLLWTPAPNAGIADLNASLIKIDSQSVPSAGGAAAYVATAGTGAGTGHSGQFNLAAATLGASSFSGSENWVTLLRCPTGFATVGTYQVTLSVQQGANAYGWYAGSTNVASSFAYGVQTSYVAVSSQNFAGYLQVQLAFGATVSDQIIEAEAMTLGTGTSTAVDALASGTGSNTTTATRTTDANPHVSRATWPNSLLATYRLFARAKVSANSASIYAATPNFPTAASSNFVGTAVDDATVGTIAWTSPGNAVNNNFAAPTTAALTAAQVSHYLKATNFLLTVPSNAVILGIQPTIYRFAGTNTFVKDNSVKLVKAGTIVGTDRASATIWQTGPQSVGYGSGSDLWGTTWTPAEINAVGFGVALSATAVGGSDTAKIYWATIAVTYRLNGNVITVSSLVYQWYDMGEVPGGSLDIHGWMSGGAGTFSLDRVEAILVQDRVRNGAIYSGARDQGQAALFDSRVEGCLVAR